MQTCRFWYGRSSYLHMLHDVSHDLTEDIYHSDDAGNLWNRGERGRVNEIRGCLHLSLCDALIRYLQHERTMHIRLKSIKAAMRNHIAEKYQYHEQEKQTCHEATRTTVLEHIGTWIRDKSTGATMKHCRWVTSIPAAGKTPIAMTTARCLLAKENEQPDFGDDAPSLYAQYFCNRKNNLSNIHNLFPTLALQLAEKSPAAASMIQTSLSNQPSFGYGFSRTQAESIFVNPLRHLAGTSAHCILSSLSTGLMNSGLLSETIYQKLTKYIAKYFLAFRRMYTFLAL